MDAITNGFVDERGVGRFTGTVDVETAQRSVDIARHGQGNGASRAVVVDPHTKDSGCGPVYLEIPFFTEGSAEMVHVHLVGVLDEKVVHHEGEVDVPNLMPEETGCVGTLKISVHTNGFARQLMSKEASWGETIDALVAADHGAVMCPDDLGTVAG